MSVTEDIADKLALDTLAAVEKYNDLSLIDDLGKLLEASSSAAHESFMAAIRARSALARARKLLDDKIAAHDAKAQPPAGKPPG